VSGTRRRGASSGTAGLDTSTVLLWTALVVLTGGGALVTGAVHLGARLQARLDGPAAAPVDLPANPFELLASLATGRQPWPPAATAVLVALAVLALLAASAAALLWRRRTRGRTPVDRVARHLGRLSAVRTLTEDGARRRAKRLGVQASDAAEPVPAGLPIGRHVPSGRLLVSSWEDVCVDIWGPRTGKTTSRVVPAILAAPGAVLATSNKRDLVDATRDVRAQRGQVWVFDPQGVAEEAATWWWDPLSYVVDEVKAVTLARLFATAGQGRERAHRRLLRQRSHLAAGQPAAGRRRRRAPNHPGLLVAGRPPRGRAGGDPARPRPPDAGGRGRRGRQRP